MLFRSEKYALEKPVSVTVELVYSTDTFKPLKKNRENRVESYDFEINNAFDRGEIVGGFGYIEYEEPTKNKLIIMTLKDILKRKPEKASGEFWGGKKTAWEKGQKVEVETEGWFEEVFEGKYSPDIVRAAFAVVGKKEATKAEAEELVKKFANKEVKN